MGDNDHGHTVFCKFLHDLKYFTDHLRIQCAGRLIKEHHIGIHSKRPCDRYTLLLSAGEHPRVGVCLIRKPDALQQILCLRIRLLLAHFLKQDRSECNVLPDRFHREQIELLEYHAHPLPDLIDIRLRIGQGDSLEDNLSAGRLFQQIEAAQEGGLARSGRTDDNDLLAFFDMLINPAKDLLMPKAFLKILCDNHFRSPFPIFRSKKPISADRPSVMIR